MIKKIFFTSHLLLFSLLFLFCIIISSSATNAGTTNAKKQGLSTQKLGEFAQGDILFYDPSDCISGSSSGGNVSVCDANLPAETIEILDNANIKEKAEENMERYKYAEEKTGLAWQVLAALHFREGGMGSNQSILNGEELYGHTNVDGQWVSADPNEDAENAAKHFIENAEAIYDKDVVNDKSMDSLGYGFLAYNRGYMYKCNGDISYKESPYVMNFYDEDHIRMKWISADSTLCDGSQINDVAGYTNEAVGTLAVLAYLCGEGLSGSTNTSSASSTSTSASTTTSSSNSNSSASSVSGDNITWIGDSYSVGAQSIIEEKYPGISFGGSVNDSSSTIQGSKFVSGGDSSNPSCLTILQDIIDADNLKPHLVFACGTNGGWTDDDTSKFQEMIKGKNTKAVVVTSKTPVKDYTGSNELLKEMADSNDDISLADWTTVYEESYFDSDPEKTHPATEPGYEKWVGVISDALGDGGGCRTATYEGDYPQYNQCGDSRWSDKSYSTDNICGSGCGAASMAMLATVATGQDIFPNDIADLLGNQYYDSTSIGTLDPIVGDHYGFEVEVVNTSGVEDAKDKMRDYLKKGYMIHFTGRGCYPGFIYASGGCTSGHVIGLFDIDENDIVTQANSGMGEVHQKASLDDMANALNFNIFTAIKGSNSGSVTCDTGNTCNDSKSAGAGTQTDKPIGPIHEDSTDIPCDPRTKDLGIRDDAYYNYERYSIRLCSIPNIRMVDTQGDDGDDGYVHVNSRVSGAFYSLSEEHNNRCGNYLEAVDDYRTNAEQQALYDAYLNGTGNLAAVPGSPYSNHQQGLAIDFDTSTYCSNDSSVASGPGGYFELDFLDMFGLEDGRYFSQSENWHVQAKEE